MNPCMAYYKGQPIFGPRGPAGPDGNPVGTVISFLGTSAPPDYLICDGAEHSISDYPELAAFFETQFGTKNHFGGDGETTFAVPDMRNLFLRGYHGDAEEQLSGEVGARQEGTEIPAIFPGVNSKGQAMSSIHLEKNTEHIRFPKNTDTAHIPQSEYWGGNGSIAPTIYENSGDMTSYTSRPVNMAVLFCIKAVESVPAGNVYSTEETRIGTWIDGKPLYRITLVGTSPSSMDAHIPVNAHDFEDIDTIASISCVLYRDDSVIASPDNTTIVSIRKDSKKLSMFVANGTTGNLNKKIIATVEYTKTTD